MCFIEIFMWNDFSETPIYSDLPMAITYQGLFHPYYYFTISSNYTLEHWRKFIKNLYIAKICKLISRIVQIVTFVTLLRHIVNLTRIYNKLNNKIIVMQKNISSDITDVVQQILYLNSSIFRFLTFVLLRNSRGSWNID